MTGGIQATDWTKLGAVVRSVRQEQGLTQRGLAEKAGVSRAWLARFEGGHRRAEVEQVFRLLAALGLSLSLQPTRRSLGETAVLAALDEDETANTSTRRTVWGMA